MNLSKISPNASGTFIFIAYFFFILEFNPKLGEVAHPTRVAYVKFMAKKIKRDVKFTDDTEQATIENEKRNDSPRGSQRSFDKIVRGSMVNKSVLQKQE